MCSTHLLLASAAAAPPASAVPSSSPHAPAVGGCRNPPSSVEGCRPVAGGWVFVPAVADVDEEDPSRAGDWQDLGSDGAAGQQSASAASFQERASEHLQALLDQESTGAYLLCPDYLSELGGARLGTALAGEEWRRKLCEWCYEVADHFDFDREVVAYALSYLDRTVAAKTIAAGPGGGITKRSLQLIAVASLYVAVKLHGEIAADASASSVEAPRRKLGIQVFVQLGRHFFTVQDIEDMERTILETLCWRMNPPTCLRFLRPLLELCPSWNDEESRRSAVLGGLYDVARYLSELSVCASAFAFGHAGSETAVAAVLCALEAVHPSLPLPDDVRGSFLLNIAQSTGLTASDDSIRRARRRLMALCPSLFPPERVLAGSGLRGAEEEGRRYAADLPHVIVPSPLGSGASSSSSCSPGPSRNSSPVSVALEIVNTTSATDGASESNGSPTPGTHRKRVRHS